MVENGEHDKMDRHQLKCSKKMKPMTSEDDLPTQAPTDEAQGAAADRFTGQSGAIETVTSSEPTDRQSQPVTEHGECEQLQQARQERIATVRALEQQLEKIKRDQERRRAEVLKEQVRALDDRVSDLRRQIDEASKADNADDGQREDGADQ
jgi:vacuolar-type H+-ATPase subunit I/STV1